MKERVGVTFYFSPLNIFPPGAKYHMVFFPLLWYFSPLSEIMPSIWYISPLYHTCAFTCEHAKWMFISHCQIFFFTYKLTLHVHYTVFM